MRGIAVGVGLPFESERKKESGLVLMNTTACPPPFWIVIVNLLPQIIFSLISHVYSIMSCRCF
jgi:hypothetical protein